MAKFIGVDASDSKAIFEILKSLDTSNNFSRIGGSVAYALSIAAAAASLSLDAPLFAMLNDQGPYRYPYPLGNIVGGGSMQALVILIFRKFLSVQWEPGLSWMP